MDKKVLTIKMLKKDLRGYAIGSFVISLLLLPGFAPCCYFAVAWFLDSFVLGILFAAGSALFGVVLVVLLANGVKLIVLLFRCPVVVVASRVSSGDSKLTLWTKIMHHRRTGIIYIHFHGYGSHPSLNVTLESTSVGDKFYLLLDGADHIIDYYPCNDYEYEGELSPNKYER